MDKKIKPKTNLKDIKNLRILIDGEWTAYDFGLFFSSIQKLYGYYFELERGKNIYKREKAMKKKYSDESHSVLSAFLRSNSIFDHFLRNIPLFDNRIISGKYKRVFEGELKVKQIAFASPGFTDFLGLAGIIEQLKEIMFYYMPNKKSKEEIRILQQKRIEMQIENLKKLGFSEIEIKQIILLEEIELNSIQKLINEGKIQKLEIK